jgi:hypothetical protein
MDNLVEAGMPRDSASEQAQAMRQEAISGIEELENKIAVLEHLRRETADVCKGPIKARVHTKGVKWLIEICSSTALYNEMPKGKSTHVPAHFIAE